MPKIPTKKTMRKLNNASRFGVKAPKPKIKVRGKKRKTENV